MNITTLLRRTVRDRPDNLAVRIEGDELTYSELYERIERFAGHLHTRGIREGGRVGFLLPNGPEFVIGVFGAWAIGAVAVPLNSMFPDVPLSHALRDSDVGLLVVQHANVERVLGLGIEGLETITAGEGGEFAEAIRAEAPRNHVTPRLDGDDAVIMYTSGSTGVPKGVRQTHRNLTAHADAVIDYHDLTPDDHVLNCMPMFHVGGLQLGTLPFLLRGGQLTYMARWDVDRWIELAQTLRPTYGGLISTMMIDVGNRTRERKVDLDSFAVCLFGGSRTPTAALERLEQGTGIHPTEMYGQTEQNGLVVSYRRGEQRRGDAMGRPLEQIVRTRLISLETDEDIAPDSDEPGELWVKGDAVTPGYWNIEATERWRDGWLRTSDLIYRDPDGYLHYVDRVDDMIITGGENVFPQMVEEHLASHPDLAEVVVIGTTHERWVQQVTAVVVRSRQTLTEEELAEWISKKAELNSIHKPRRIEFVDALPRTGSGKINRPEIRHMFP